MDSLSACLFVVHCFHHILSYYCNFVSKVQANSIFNQIISATKIKRCSKHSHLLAFPDATLLGQYIPFQTSSLLIVCGFNLKPQGYLSLNLVSVMEGSNDRIYLHIRTRLTFSIFQFLTAAVNLRLKSLHSIYFVTKRQDGLCSR